MNQYIKIKLWAFIGLLLLNIKDGEAQQTGPTNPDFYGFEPVDATDMVNVMTGDLTYTQPLLMVPGPAGGYPVTISYTSGVGVKQEATWVGMGWRLTPGGIHRRTNGVADDVVAINRNRVTINGEAEYETVGANFATATGISVGATASWGDFQSLGVSGGYGGVSGYADTEGNVGVSVNPIKLLSPKSDAATDPKSPISSTSVGLNYNLKSGKLSGTVGLSKFAVGVSLTASSEGISVNASLAGNSLKNKNVSTNSTSTISSSRDGLTLPIPVPGGIFALSYYKTKIDWTSTTALHTMQLGLMYPYIGTYDLAGYDQYRRTLNTASMDVNEIDYSEYYFQNSVAGADKPNVLLPAYDDFNVVAQGMSFSMSNRLMETGMLSTFGNVSGKKMKDVFYGIPHNTEITTNYQQFQVNHTNSDQWTIRPGTLDASITSTEVLNSDALHSFLYDNNPLTFHSKSTTAANQPYIDHSYKFGKKFIKYYTNAEIASGLGSSFIEGTHLNTTKRQSMPADGIGAYQITNEQGVTYHYSVPVYQDLVLSQSIEDVSDNSGTNYHFSQNINDNRYANSWLLTAITGPDYIDVNNDGPDESDYGYWVELDYGLLHEHYLWKTSTPIEKSFSRPSEDWSRTTYGLKEVYYLDKIRTATHTAMFFKGERSDGYSGGVWGGTNAVGAGSTSMTVDGYTAAINTYSDKVGYLLKLDHIALFKNDNLPTIVQQSHASTKYCNTCETNVPQLVRDYPGTSKDMTKNIGYHLMNNLLDYKEYQAHQSDIESKAIQIVNLDYNYDIRNGSYNSQATNKGKLTLSKIIHYSRGGHQTLPSQEFEYYLDHAIDNSSLSAGVLDRKTKTDSWGYYSSDYNIDQAHTWSLKSITNPLGSKINFTYESDEFVNEYALGSTLRHRVTDIEHISSNIYKLVFPNEFDNQFQVNDIIKLRFRFEIHEDGLSTYLKNHTQSPDPNTGVIEGDVNYIVRVTYVDPQHKRLNIAVLNATGDYGNTTIHPITNGVFQGLVAHKIGFNRHTRFYELEAFEENPVASQSLKGGGLRVSTVSLTDNNTTFNTNYNYNTFGTNITSGYTSYAPKEFYRGQYIPYAALLPSPGVSYANVSVTKTSSDAPNAQSTTKYTFNLPKNCENCFDAEYEIPGFFSVEENIAPGDQLEIVSGSGPFTHEHNDVVYHRTLNSPKQYSNFNIRDVEITNNLNRIGELTKVERINGSGQVLYSQENVYIDNYQAKKEEGYYNRKILHDYEQNLQYKHNLNGNVIQLASNRHYYNYFNTIVNYREIPRVLSRTETTSQGIKNRVWYKDFDVLLGTAKTTITENSFGDRYRSSQIYAHEVNAYSEMGPKADNPNNKNMLTQTAASYVFIDNSNDIYVDDPVVDASVTTWNKQWKYREFNDGEYKTSLLDPLDNPHVDVWRKKTTYSWRSKLNPETGAYLKVDGSNTLFNYNDYFNFSNISSYQNNTQGWVQNSEVTLYDHFSNPREVKDVNGQYAASKTWKGLTVSNITGAAYTDYCASGAEELISGKPYNLGVHPRFLETETQLGILATLNTSKAHTGKRSVYVNGAGKEAFVSDIKYKSELFGTYYTLSVWVHGNIGSNGEHIALRVTPFAATQPIVITNPDIIQAGDWYQLRYTFQLGTAAASGGSYLGTKSKISIGANAYNGDLYFDDYRLSPVGAALSTYVYDDLDRLEYVLDGHNLGTKYLYDDQGRLKEVYSEKVGADGGFVKTAESAYHMIRDNQ